MTLPQGWAQTTIADVAETKLGKMLDATKNKGEPASYLRNVNVRWGAFDLSDLLEMRVTADEREALSVRDGDLFMCEGGEPGRCAVWRGGERDLVFQKAIHRVRPFDGVETDYLATHIAYLAAEDGLSHLFTGTTIKHLPQAALQRITLPLPPAAEQRRIVAKLDVLTARLARARAELDRVPVLAAKLRQEVLRAAFDLDRARAHHTPITSVGDIAQISSGFGFPKHLQGKAAGAYPFAKVSDISQAVRDSRGEIDRAANFVDDDDLKILRAKPIPAGSTVFAKIGEALRLNRRGIARASIVLDNNCMALSPDGQVAPEYLFYFMQTVDLSPFAVATAVPSVRRGDVAALRLPLPDLSVQAQVVRQVQAAFARADRLEAEAARARVLIDRLEAAILARAFRGELVPQDPADEPAGVLLDRIRARRAAAAEPRRSRRS